MTRKFDRKQHRKSAGPPDLDYTGLDSDITREKQKARKLKHSPWWKKKISSGVCHYCRGTFNPSDLTMDHIIPLSRGGKSERINIVAACKECNNRKKYLLPVEWEEYLQQIVKTKVD